MAETKEQHWQRRSRELVKKSKSELVALYRRMGGMGGLYPPEEWYKEEVVASIVHMEWNRLPDEYRKVNDR